MFFVFTTLALFAMACHAMPAFQARQLAGPNCEGFGPASFGSASNFKLAAWNRTLPNANSTGVPLVYGSLASEEANGETFGVISTLASVGFDEFPTWSLQSGALLPNGPFPGHVTDLPVPAGNLPSWALGYNLPAPQQMYCAHVSTSAYGGSNGYPILAINGDSSSWSLCPNNKGRVNLVYAPSMNNDGQYDLHQCHSVLVQIIQSN